ncbi:hypothetical protein Dsin_030881 [Dipteronia sinensis]|uniref:Uncharacterized protein n=1 Tax=Dipteronia sinensis TaxID=43782 RepID=A0AAD9ZKH3_9ROSI|nr:hypothetical protein Dsin_030881 [Dipteronia sinensis]
MDFDTISIEDFPSFSTLPSEIHPMNLDVGNKFSGKLLLQNPNKRNDLNQICQDLPKNNTLLNSPNFDPSVGVGSSRNLFSGASKTRFDSYGDYAKGVSTEINPLLHGSESTRFWDCAQKIEAQTTSKLSIHRPISLLDQYKSTRETVADNVSSIFGKNAYHQKVDENRLERIHERSCKHSKETDIIKGHWKPEEDELLISLVHKHGSKNWSLIAGMISGRVGKQCRERWYNHLKSDIKAHRDLGNHWIKIAPRLPGRSENSIKNHWNAAKRRKTKDSTRINSLLQDYIRSLVKLSTAPATNDPDNQTQEPTMPSTQALEDWQVPKIDHNKVLNGVPSTSIVDEGNLVQFEIPSEINASFMEMIYKGL